MPYSRRSLRACQNEYQSNLLALTLLFRTFFDLFSALSLSRSFSPLFSPSADGRPPMLARFFSSAEKIVPSLLLSVRLCVSSVGMSVRYFVSVGAFVRISYLRTVQKKRLSAVRNRLPPSSDRFELRISNIYS